MANFPHYYFESFPVEFRCCPLLYSGQCLLIDSDMNFPFNNKTISQKLASREENQEKPRPSLKI